jgi:crotonobetainyl-CoA:carnitine CoA-transferase CaiB-like acyl-CoA transferase
MPRGAFGDAPSGAMLAGGVAAALFAREKTGRGVVVDVALLATAVWQLSTDLTATAVLREDPKRLSAGKTLANPMVGPFRAGDDKWLMLNMLDDVRHWPPLCKALGLDDLVDDAGRSGLRHQSAARAAARSCESD